MIKVFLAVMFTVVMFVVGYVLSAHVPAFQEVVRVSAYVGVGVAVLALLISGIMAHRLDYSALFVLSLLAGFVVGFCVTSTGVLAPVGTLMAGGGALGCVVVVAMKVNNANTPRYSPGVTGLIPE